MAMPLPCGDERSVSLLAILLIGALLLGRGPSAAHGQSRLQTQRAFVASPQVLGMGNAGGALPHTASGFFYNPAHMSRAGRQLVLFGIQGQFSTGVIDQVRFFADRLEPALDRGLETLPDDELQTLYDDTIDRGYRPTTFNGTLLLPALLWEVGPVGAGIGFFSYTDLTYRFGDAGLGVPRLDLVGRTDVMGRAGVGTELAALGLPGLAVGLTGSLTRRYFTAKDKPLDAIDSGEEVLLLQGTSLGLDVGLFYDVPARLGPGTLTLGVAAYDLHATGFDYTFYGTAADWPLLGGAIGVDGDPPGAQQIDREVRRANERFALTTSYRLGAAYRLQGLAALPEAVVTLDYLGYEDPPVDLSWLARLHLGAEVQALPGFVVRAGLSQGYPTAGVGFELGTVHVDYAFHGVEHGRYPGQIPSYQHTLQLLVTLF